jgi:hypothetical protein
MADMANVTTKVQVTPSHHMTIAADGRERHAVSTDLLDIFQVFLYEAGGATTEVGAPGDNMSWLFDGFGMVVLVCL